MPIMSIMLAWCDDAEGSPLLGFLSKVETCAPTFCRAGRFVLSLFLLTSSSTAARDYRSFEQPLRARPSRPEQTLGVASYAGYEARLVSSLGLARTREARHNG